MNNRFYTLIDYNRAGVSLEKLSRNQIFSTPKDVRIFLNRVHYFHSEHLGISDTKCEEGSVRCDANVSVGQGKKVEIKNIGSFKEVERKRSIMKSQDRNNSVHDIEIQAETRTLG